MADTDTFSGFPREGLEFLTTLGARDKAWFDENRSIYERAVVAPTKAFEFWDGDNKKTAPTLWVRISETDIGFASGATFPSVERWRELVADEEKGAELDAILTELGRGRNLDIAGPDYKKVPKPFDKDHPRADLLRRKQGLQARWSEPTPASVIRASFVDWCRRRLGARADLHHWSKANL